MVGFVERHVVISIMEHSTWYRRICLETASATINPPGGTGYLVVMHFPDGNSIT